MPRTACIVTGFAAASLMLLAGCGGGETEEFKPLPGNQPEVPAAPAHVHGPHGGHLIELGNEEYHAELVFDAKSRKTTIYILDGAAKGPHPIDATEIELHLEADGGEVELMLQAAPEAADGEGKSSRFELAADQLPESIKDEEDFAGHLLLEIDGKSFSGDIKHDHDH
jgi:hypothetical protein